MSPLCIANSFKSEAFNNQILVYLFWERKNRLTPISIGVIKFIIYIAIFYRYFFN